MMGPFDPVLIRKESSIKTGSKIRIARIDKRTSTILFVIFSQGLNISGLTDINKAPKMELILTEPVKMLYISAITFMLTLRSATSFMILFIFSCSLGSVAIITSSIWCELITFFKIKVAINSYFNFSKSKQVNLRF